MITSFLFFLLESLRVCSKNFDNNKTILSITFGAGSDQYNTKIPADFNFSISTSYQQMFSPNMRMGTYVFVNDVPKMSPTAWHGSISDHTDDDGGYMYFIDINDLNSEIFRMTIDNLCVNQVYQFAAYLSNPVKKQSRFPSPTVRFEVQTATPDKNLLAQCNTTTIAEYDTPTWRQYGISFNASNSSVILLIISNVKGGDGSDLIIDDIELRALSTESCYYHTSGQYIFEFSF